MTPKSLVPFPAIRETGDRCALGAKALETRTGRWIFWIAVAAAFLGMGVNAVIRAELPQKVFVPRLPSAGPHRVNAPENVEWEWRSSEFRGFRSIAWGIS